MPFSPWHLTQVYFVLYLCIHIPSIFNKQHLHSTVCIVRNIKSANRPTGHRPCRWKGLVSSPRTLIQLQYPVNCIDFRAATWVSIGSDRILPHCPCAKVSFGFLRAQVFPTSLDCPLQDRWSMPAQWQCSDKMASQLPHFPLDNLLLSLSV